MKAISITKHEKTFFQSGRDSDGKEFVLTDKSVRIKNTNQLMPYIHCRPRNGDTSFYFQEKKPKTQIVLHYTAGYLKGDVAALSKPNYRVSTPFIVARNGAIINMWSSAYWAYHLGSGAVGGNTKGSKRSIAIEISNIGFLKRIGNRLVTVYNDNDTYCTIDQEKLYIKLSTPFRGQLYYATFTKQQYTSIALLLNYLTAEYNIPKIFLPEDKRYKKGKINDLPNFKGITSHANYRSSGKWDIGPAFDWDRLMTIMG